MLPTFLKKAKIPQKIKQNLYGLYIFDNQPILANKEKIDKETRSVLITVGIY
jgi:hypothetical protein